jgi:UDP-N-acetylglucosamine 1-carboxyvinyltransferase
VTSVSFLRKICEKHQKQVQFGDKFMNKKQKFIIQGLSGKKTLVGRISINGAKNSALKAMAASILFEGEVILNNIPNTEDIHTMKDILVDLGAKVQWLNDNNRKVIKIYTKDINKTEINTDLAITMRASVVLTGPMLTRFGKVSFPAPGGCVIGARPIDLFIEGYKKMGATVILKNNLYHIEAPRGLQGTGINFNKISVGGTETLMMASTLANGVTVLKNCAKEPEIVNVAEWLNVCGANIKGVGTETITIEGNGGELLKCKQEYTAIPDRIEAGSFLILGALCAEKLYIDNLGK